MPSVLRILFSVNLTLSTECCSGVEEIQICPQKGVQKEEDQIANLSVWIANKAKDTQSHCLTVYDARNNFPHSAANKLLADKHKPQQRAVEC